MAQDMIAAQLSSIGVESEGFGFDHRNSLRLFIVDKKSGVSVDFMEVMLSCSGSVPAVKSRAVLPAATWATMAPSVMGDFNEQLKASKRKAGSWKNNARTPVDDSFGKELIALAWAVEDIPADRQDLVENALVGWAFLKREERWWLYLKADGDSSSNAGWRKAIKIALGK